jgi:hypothetical protein
VTTPGTNGAPEDAADDDPFAYLYRPQAGEAAAEQPRGSINRPMEVGRASYGQQPGYGQSYPPPQPQYGQQQPPYGQPVVPQQPNRYAEHSRPQPGEERPSGGRGKATVIGAVAVVAAIAIGAGIALSGGDKSSGDTSAKSGHTTAPVTAPPSTSAAPSTASSSPTASSAPIADASKLQGTGTSSANAIKGAISADGSYLTLPPGSSVTWTVTVDTAASYKFWLHFNNTGSDMTAAVSVNGKDRDGGVTLKNYGKGSDPTQAWYSTNIWPQLQAGTNTLTVTIPAGGSGSILLDQVALTPMSVSTYPGH